jgi:plastocyanin domain-containing protein
MKVKGIANSGSVFKAASGTVVLVMAIIHMMFLIIKRKEGEE